MTTERVSIGSMLDTMFSKRRDARALKEDNQGTDVQPDGSNAKPDAETMASGDVTPDEIIEKLNSIRAGKSFRDSAISTGMDTYIKGLTDAERTALFAFLKGIAQVVSGEVPSQDVVDPSDTPAGVSMKKDKKALSVHVKPNVIKKGGGTATSSEPVAPKTDGVEDTTGPAPIKAKQKT